MAAIPPPADMEMVLRRQQADEWINFSSFACVLDIDDHRLKVQAIFALFFDSELRFIEYVTLKTVRGSWKVKKEFVRKKCYLEEGFEAFINGNRLSDGNVLVFVLTDPWNFNVQRFSAVAIYCARNLGEALSSPAIAPYHKLIFGEREVKREEEGLTAAYIYIGFMFFGCSLARPYVYISVSSSILARLLLIE